MSLNKTIHQMGPYSLRVTDVNKAEARAFGMGLNGRIREARLGDPTRHGTELDTYLRYCELHEEIAGAHAKRRLVKVPELKETGIVSLGSYSDSRGFPPLRQVLAKECGLPVEQIFLGAGISGIVRALFETFEQGNVVIPEWTYILYLSETLRRQNQIATSLLDKTGQPDLDSLKDSIGPQTNAVTITPVGNPVCVGMEKGTFDAIVEMVNAKETQYGHPIFLIVDTEYENFRPNRNESVRPMAQSNGSRLGPTIEMFSISKMIAAPGDRVGWIKVYWGDGFRAERDEFLKMMENLLQPQLGQVALRNQLATYLLFRRINGGGEYHDDYERFKDTRRTQVRERVVSFLEEIERIPGVVLPEFYYRNGILAPQELHGFYVLFGFDKELLPRDPDSSQARRLAEYAIDNGLAIPLFTPGDSFLAADQAHAERNAQEYIRAVALFNGSVRSELTTAIREFANHLR